MQDEQKLQDQEDHSQESEVVTVSTVEPTSSDVPSASSAESSDDSELDEANESADQGLIDTTYKWYIVNTYAGSEDSAKLNLLDRVNRAGFEHFFRDVVVPKVSSEKILKSGKKKQVEKTSFPGYLFVQMDLTEETMATVTGTPRVTGFVGNYRNPRPMSDKEVLRLLGSVVEDGADGDVSAVPTQKFEKGETIKVVDGPFTNFDGVVEEIRPDKMKLKVLVSIFGRETPVELAYSQVEKMS